MTISNKIDDSYTSNYMNIPQIQMKYFVCIFLYLSFQQLILFLIVFWGSLCWRGAFRGKLKFRVECCKIHCLLGPHAPATALTSAGHCAWLQLPHMTSPFAPHHPASPGHTIDKACLKIGRVCASVKVCQYYQANCYAFLAIYCASVWLTYVNCELDLVPWQASPLSSDTQGLKFILFCQFLPSCFHPLHSHML